MLIKFFINYLDLTDIDIRNLLAVISINMYKFNCLN
uniref:Uncharacterized protein n=1 Tax=Pyropia yezoensis TaxID=2788 RepID=M4QGP5_PYRYE|nr:hypothetical protein 5 [Neopyropia yezoensis]AGH27641.1 hypothetical protein PyyeCp131 [Neopyropia yezoensis]QFZ66977.1 hypothetical protein PyyePp131 [Neopyropia yezoensis]WKD83472.1 hypothetical protein [Neopyropia yezoensis]BAE92438.1 unnamed protein product [Neopyropia yezoensis]